MGGKANEILVVITNAYSEINKNYKRQLIKYII